MVRKIGLLLSIDQLSMDFILLYEPYFKQSLTFNRNSTPMKFISKNTYYIGH